MKKVIILSVILFSVILSLSTSNAFAKKLEPSLGPYMTDEAITVKKEVFGWDEKPFAFIQFDVNDLNINKPLKLWWKWRYDGEGPVSHEFERITDFPENPLNLWNSLDNWNLHKKVGEWSVKTSWHNPGGGTGSQIVNFTITPEPVSLILFLVGGIALTARYYQKKRKES